MFNNRKVYNRVISRQNWRQIVALMGYKASIRLLNPRNSTKTCPRCGGQMERLEGRALKCNKCKLIINRQLGASINLYLRMWGFTPSMRAWEEVILPILRRGGVAPNGREAHDVPPMSPEGDEAHVRQGLHGPINAYVS